MSVVPPGVRVITGYRRAWLGKDVVAGVVLTTLLVPQGMAYAELAGLPAITGLYTTILCLLGYAVFGPSRILVLGPGLLARADDRRDDPPAGRRRRRSRAGGRAGVDARAHGRRDHDRWPASPSSASSPTCCPSRRMIGYMNGLAADHPGRPAAQAVRVLGRRRRPDRRGRRRSSRASPTARPCRPPLAVGLGGLVADPGPAALAAEGPGGARRGRARDRRRRRRSTSATTASSLVGRAAAGLPAAHDPDGRAGRTSALLVAGALGIALVSLADTISTASAFAARTGAGGRRQPGDDRHRRGQPRRRAVPGLPGQHQRLAHRGRRAERAPRPS